MAELIRTWREEDLPAIAALLGELDAALGEENPLDPAAVLAHFRAMRDRPETYECLVLEEEGLVLGFLSLLFYRSVWHRVGTAQVNELVVAAGSRGRGIGERLLARAVAEARERGMDEIEVGVEGGNDGALRFYRREGFDREYRLLGRDLGQGSGQGSGEDPAGS